MTGKHPHLWGKKSGAARFRDLRERVYARDNGLCWYCNAKLSFEDATLEHLVPRSLGGENNEQNTVVACKKCNNGASQLTTMEEKKQRRLELRTCSLCKEQKDMSVCKVVCQECRENGAFDAWMEQQENAILSNVPDFWTVTGVESGRLARIISLSSASQFRNCKIKISHASPPTIWSKNADHFGVYLCGPSAEDAIRFLKYRASHYTSRYKK